MATQLREVEGIGPVTFQKRRGSRSIRLHIHGNDVKVTMPHYITYAFAERFVYSRKDWIQKHQKVPDLLVPGTTVGKKHTITSVPGSTLRTRIKGSQLELSLPPSMKIDDNAVQQRLKTAAERVLKQESEELVVPRLQDLAYEHGFSYKSAKCKKLKSRWGSCDSESKIVLNIYLVQLPWRLIDYVLIHELAHTVHHDHSKNFWARVEDVLPDYKIRRKDLKKFQSLIVVS